MIFPSSADMWTTVADGANEQNVFVSAVMEQLGDALVAKAVSTTVAIATFEAEEITPVIADLRQKGYIVTNDNTNLTISWGPQN